MCNKFSDISCFIENSNYDIVTISETWLNSDLMSESYTIDNFKLFRRDRDGRGGGVAIYVTSKLKATPIDTPDFNNRIDQLWLNLRYNKQSVTIGVIYRSPSVPYSQLSCLHDVISEVICDCDVLVCTGDFNVNLLNPSSTECKFFNDILDSLSLNQIIDEPTRLTPSNETLIDLVLVNNVNLVINHGVLPCDPIATDHEAVFCQLKCEKSKSNNSVKEGRDLSLTGTDEFGASLQQIDWPSGR